MKPLLARPLVLVALALLGAAASKPTPPTFRLPAGVRPTRYALDLKIVPAAPTFSGTVAIDLQLVDREFLNPFQVLREEGLAHGESLKADMFPSGGGADWEAEVSRIYDATRLRADFTAALEDVKELRVTNVLDAACLGTSLPPACTTATLVTGAASTTYLWAGPVLPSPALQSRLGGATTGYDSYALGYQGGLRPNVGTLSIDAPLNERLKDLSLRLFAMLDFVPARMTAFGFAVVGNFEEAVTCWRNGWPASHRSTLSRRCCAAMSIAM